LLIVADNIQITNPEIERALKQMKPKPIQDLVRRCQEAGADMLDINAGPLLRNAEATMTFLIETVQQVSHLPLCLDTSNPVAMEAGLKANKGKAVINGFSLEPQKLKSFLPLAQKYDTDIIGFLLLPNGQVPAKADERLHVAVQLFEAFKKTSIDSQKLIIDPIVVPMSWGDGQQHAREVLYVLRTLRDLLGFPVRTIAGLSNLTTGTGNQKSRRRLEEVYLAMLSAHGLSLALFNVLHTNTVRITKTCNAITGNKVFSWEEI
jgi:5-methyltetrahydrofolate corrinoid/iron sulfur protein methyltransferase